MSWPRLILALSAIPIWVACATPGPAKPEAPAQAAPAPPRPLGLAERLPADTTVYARLDLRRALDEVTAYLRYVDPEGAEQLVVQTRRAYESMVQMAANRGFKPSLAATLDETRWHLLVLAEEPEPDPGGAATGRHHNRLLGPDRVVVLAVETGPEVAADFLVQVRAELERQAARRPERKDFTWTQIPMEGGELIRLEGPGIFLGVKGDFLVAADGPPRRFWAALDTPAPDSLAETERYQRIAVDEPSAFAVGDLRSVIRDSEEAAAREREAALAGLDSARNPAEQRLHQSRLEALDAFSLVKRLIGLDRFIALGGRAEFSESQEGVRLSLVGELIYEPPVAPLVAQAFDGGRAFRLPTQRPEGGLAVMWRLGLGDMYRMVTEALDDK